MRKILIALAALAISLSAAAQRTTFPNPVMEVPAAASQWAANPTYVMDFKWHRTSSGLPWVEDGVCHLVLGDNQRDLTAGEDQVRFCISKGATKAANAPLLPNAKRVHLYYVDGNTAMDQLMAVVFGRESGRPSIAKNCQFDCFRERGGFYLNQADHCKIALNSKALSFGHEYKHCEDGLFHDDHANWK